MDTGSRFRRCVALHRRRAGRCARADVLRHARQMQGMRRRSDARHGAAVAADRRPRRISTPAAASGCRASAASSRTSGAIDCHTMRRGHMRIERNALHLPVTHETTPLDPAVARDGDRILTRSTGEEIDALDRPDSRPRDRSRHHHRRRPPDRSRNRRAGRRHVVRESAALRRLGRDVPDPLRHGAPGPAADAHARRLPEPRHRRPSRSIRRRSTKWCVVGNSTMRDLFFRQSVYSIGQNPYRSITEIEMAEGKRTTTSLTTTGRRSLLPIHPNARVYGLPVISGHVGADAAACMLAVDLAQRRAARRDHGHRHQHRAASSATAIASWRRRVRPVRHSKAARSRAACRGSMARSKTSRSTTTARSGSA